MGYYEGEHLHVWFDGNSKKTLVHAYEEDWFNHKGETHHIFSLRDYNKKFHWNGHLEQFDREFEQYCLAKSANMTGSGTIGQHAMVDFWQASYEDKEKKFYEDIHLIAQRSSTKAVVQERVFGEHFNETEQELWKWIEHREWFDFSEAPLSSSVFNIPLGCPNVLSK